MATLALHADEALVLERRVAGPAARIGLLGGGEAIRRPGVRATLPAGESRVVAGGAALGAHRLVGSGPALADHRRGKGQAQDQEGK